MLDRLRRGRVDDIVDDGAGAKIVLGCRRLGARGRAIRSDRSSASDVLYALGQTVAPTLSTSDVAAQQNRLALANTRRTTARATRPAVECRDIRSADAERCRRRAWPEWLW